MSVLLPKKLAFAKSLFIFIIKYFRVQIKDIGVHTN